LVFTVDGVYTSTLTLIIKGENSTNAQPFSTSSTPELRARLSGVSTTWVIPSSDVWQQNNVRQSPDVTSIVQAIVDKSGWQSGNALVILVDPATTVPVGAYRRVFAFERQGGGVLTSARLVIQTGPRKIYLPIALKNSPPPITSTSYYVTNMNPAAWYSIGNTLGISDTVSGKPRDRLVVLAFGRPRRSGSTYGVYLPFDLTYTLYSTTDIANTVKEFARGYWDGTQGSPQAQLKIVIGTNNCCPGDTISLFQGHGTAWGQMMNSVISSTVPYSNHVTLVGGSDIEMEFNGSYTTTQWLNTYMSSSQCVPGVAEAGCLYNFGNQIVAIPTTFPGPCNYTNAITTTWTACDVWYVSWGLKRANDTYRFIRPVPEVYHAPSSTHPYGYDAEQWAALSVYSANLMNAGSIYFASSLTQYARCGPICYVGDESYANNTPENGWIGLVDALGSNSSTAQFVRWITDIDTQP
jgi:hypothetical protein